MIEDNINIVDCDPIGYFDLEATYTISFISRLLKIGQIRASKLIDSRGHLTEKGLQVFHDLNDELKSTFKHKR